VQQLEAVNEKVLKRNVDIDRMVALASGDASYASQMREEKLELERLRSERDTATKAIRDENKALRDEIAPLKDENKALTEELEKDRKYPWYKLQRHKNI
jgi:hypothetical protein